MDSAISRVLRGGVLLSTMVIAAGVALTFVHHPSYVRSEAALRQLTAPEQAFPHTVRGVIGGAEQARGQALITLGLLLLIATPVARVALSIGIFTIERDHLYTSITAIVLILLLLSFIVGAAA